MDHLPKWYDMQRNIKKNQPALIQVGNMPVDRRNRTFEEANEINIRFTRKTPKTIFSSLNITPEHQLRLLAKEGKQPSELNTSNPHLKYDNFAPRYYNIQRNLVQAPLKHRFMRGEFEHYSPEAQIATAFLEKNLNKHHVPQWAEKGKPFNLKGNVVVPQGSDEQDITEGGSFTSMFNNFSNGLFKGLTLGLVDI